MSEERTMPNADTCVARRFHDETKYTLMPVPGEESEIMVGIPPDLRVAIGEQNPELEAIAATGEDGAAETVPELAALAHLCLRSNGVLKSWTNPSGKTYVFRGA